MEDSIRDAVLVLDCGATNVRAIAVAEAGAILARRSFPNATRPEPGHPEFRVWDVDEIWSLFARATREVLAEVGAHRIGAVTVTTFGVDGALVDREGSLLHPVISWQCERTLPIGALVDARIPHQALYARCGTQTMHFNTIYRLAWLQDRRPELLARAHAWLFISNLFTHRMTGVFATDATMAGTSMLTDLAQRSLARATLGDLDLDPALFPPLVEAGTVLGGLRPGPAGELGLPPGLPVVAAGHDTQFALFGSGAEENQAVLSSGTWEILMIRARAVPASEVLRQKGVTIELDAEPGIQNPGMMWIASGMVEWLKDLAFAQEDRDTCYETMIREAEAAGPGAGGLHLRGEFLDGRGGLQNLGLGTTRGQLARALFEHLGQRLRQSMTVLEEAGGLTAPALICVGGGSRNRLWNQIRADLLQRPVLLLDQEESTALGAAFFAMPALGRFRDARAARAAAHREIRTVLPGPDAVRYQERSRP